MNKLMLLCAVLLAACFVESGDPTPTRSNAQTDVPWIYVDHAGTVVGGPDSLVCIDGDDYVWGISAKLAEATWTEDETLFYEEPGCDGDAYVHYSNPMSPFQLASDPGVFYVITLDVDPEYICAPAILNHGSCYTTTAKCAPMFLLRSLERVDIVPPDLGLVAPLHIERG